MRSPIGVSVLYVRQKMKKILVLAFLVIAAVGVALLLPTHPVAKSYPRNTVISAVSSSATSLGAVLEEQRSVSGRFSTDAAFGRVGRWFREVTDQEAIGDLDELLVRSGTDTVTISSVHKNDNVQELRIRPSTSASKLSADLRREVLKTLPGIRFDP